MKNFLKARRLELALTLEDVGNYCGVGKSTVRKWETGAINDMGRSKIQKLSEVLKVSPLDILNIGDDTSSLSVRPSYCIYDFDESLAKKYGRHYFIGKMLNSLRIRSGLSLFDVNQKLLNRTIELPDNMLSRYEHGTHPVSISMLNTLCNIYDADADELLSQAENFKKDFMRPISNANKSTNYDYVREPQAQYTTIKDFVTKEKTDYSAKEKALINAYRNDPVLRETVNRLLAYQKKNDLKNEHDFEQNQIITNKAHEKDDDYDLER